jgi:hypothetical protein
MINFNGTLVPNADSQLANNRGFLFGDGVFETVRILDGKILFRRPLFSAHVGNAYRAHANPNGFYNGIPRNANPKHSIRQQLRW